MMEMKSKLCEAMAQSNPQVIMKTLELYLGPQNNFPIDEPIV